MREFIVHTDMDLNGVVEFEGVGQTFKPKGEVIRCKDCKHCNREMAVGEWEGSCRYWNTHSVMLNDFCSRAERKDDETD